MKLLNYQQQVGEAAQFLSPQIPVLPKIGMILGSGLGEIADDLETAYTIDFSEIPYFPVSTVAGHQGQLITGRLEGVQIMIMKGRIHYYEGYSMQEVTFPVRVMQSLGIETLIITNACGGVREDTEPGQICLIKDHINLMGDSPLRGKNYEDWGARFPDMSQAYARELRKLAKEVASELKISLSEGVYAAVSGPCYETLAEVAYLKIIGADLVGMSTVPEVIAAVHGGTRVLGFSGITDVLALQGDEPLSHEQVVAVSKQIRPKLILLIKGILGRL